MTSKIRASVDMENDLAVAFRQELGARVSKGLSQSKAELGRVLIAEGLRALGYTVEIPETQWGGLRSPSKRDD